MRLQPPIRLIKFVHDAARLSSRQVRAAHQSGRLCVSVPEGSAGAGALDSLVYAEDIVQLDGKILHNRQEHYYAVLNKPGQTLSVPRDPRNKGDLAPWLEQMPAGVFAVGRLDRDTTGALLLTTEGALANRLLRPERHADKCYRLLVAGELHSNDPRLQALLNGIDVGPFIGKAKALEILETRDGSTTLNMTLDEGKHRQIRRMCRAVKLSLRHLHRQSVGPISVTGLSVGGFRVLQQHEVTALWAISGGRERLVAEYLQSLQARATRCRQEEKQDLRLEAWLRSSDL